MGTRGEQASPSSGGSRGGAAKRVAVAGAVAAAPAGSAVLAFRLYEAGAIDGGTAIVTVVVMTLGTAVVAGAVKIAAYIPRYMRERTIRDTTRKLNSKDAIRALEVLCEGATEPDESQ
ncbi:hypothetical protein ACIBG8_11135 [Nonomuraea sp. NPDC050556]|uniref:hypothetical protein n=1 Tax=Nonomuraea sp. NPDC050556 TaxID=3364369 RepID=UPI00378E036C